ncbi:hypothetical protein HanPSC8_Chr16g0708951 [Helianthus annuus]|nr:hypothetical protein HanPSC8_Chr16g0708951 [Helianthus annuus]
MAFHRVNAFASKSFAYLGNEINDFRAKSFRESKLAFGNLCKGIKFILSP